MAKPSKIFVAYRALGIVCNHVPFSLRYINRRNENLVVTAVGKSFHTYGCSRLNLLSVSGQHPDDITFLTSDAYLVFSACGNTIYAWRRGTELKHVYKGPSEDVKFLFPFGAHLLAVYENNSLLFWDIKTEEMVKEIAFTNVSITTLAHPSTYENKILIGTHGGSLLLWNFKTDKLIHRFKGWKSPVTVLEQAPALHVMGIGLECGDIYIQNLETDKTIMKFSQDWGPVTGISFRTDYLQCTTSSCAKNGSKKEKEKEPMFMASSSTMGHIAVWDLTTKRLHSEIREAHKGCIASMKFLPNEPLLITSSSDNSIKMWIFDLPDDGGRLLRLREGHSCPPTKIRFYGSSGKNIISAGLDSTLRSFSTEADNLNKSLGQASYNRKAAKRKGVKNDRNKMFPVVDFVSDATREKDWDNVAAVHRNSRIVTTWSYDRSCMGEHMLIHERFKGLKNIEALCLNISTCGNFVFIGYNSGHIDKFNIQSGIYRGSFGKEKAHEGCIRGIASDNFNQMVISGASDKYLRFWKFKDHTLVNELKLEENISKMMLHRESGMLATALDDFSLVVVDIESKRVVRRFCENEGSISDMTFSPDSRWLTVATMDSSVKTWDLPRGRLVDWFTVSPICVSLAMSSTGEYLATAHAGNLGIYLWANSTLYTNVTLHPLPDLYDPLEIDLPMITLDGRNVTDVEEENNEEEMVPEFKSQEQISDELVTLSLLPQSHWLNLLDLDIIKLRNKPKEPVQVPKNAPFFLPVVSGLKPTFLIEEEKDWKKDGEKSNFFKTMQNASTFSRLLTACDENNDYKMVIEELKKLNPSTIDVEIRCLSPENGGSLEVMEYFLKAMLESLRTKKNFELVQSYLALFLQIHYDTVAGSEKLKSILEEIHKNRSWESLQEKINFCLCLGNYARSSVI